MSIRNCTVGQHRLIVPIDICWPIIWDTHYVQFVPKAANVFTTLCFITTNSDPKLLESMLVCFFENQYTSMQFRYTRNPVRDLHITMSAEWSASTLHHMTKPCPQGSGMFGSNFSTPMMWPNSIDAQSLLSNSVSSMAGSLGSNTNLVLWYFFKYAKICNSLCRWPSLGNARSKY